MKTRKKVVAAAVAAAAVLGMGLTTAEARIMDDPDYMARWYGSHIPWEVIVNDLGVDPPFWTGGGSNLNVVNIALGPPWHKQVILEATFEVSPPPPGVLDQDLELIYPDSSIHPWDQFEVDSIEQTWTVVWDLGSQQDSEILRFNSWPWAYWLSTSQGAAIEYVTVATKCVPEPATMLLLTLGGVALIGTRRTT